MCPATDGAPLPAGRTRSVPRETRPRGGPRNRRAGDPEGPDCPLPGLHLSAGVLLLASSEGLLTSRSRVGPATRERPRHRGTASRMFPSGYGTSRPGPCWGASPRITVRYPAPVV